MIVGLISSHREGWLVRGAIETALEGCDTVLVFEGPVGGATDAGEPSALDKLPSGVVVKRSEWASDATKRTQMVRWAQERLGGNERVLWGLWLDGDELLCNGRWLPDYIRRVEAGGDHGFTIRIVELQDGSIARAPSRIFRADLIDHYVHGAYQFLAKGSSVVVTLPNQPESDIEWQKDRQAHETMFMRPPLPGEPHIVHRAFLRPPSERVRLHQVETAEAQKVYDSLGIAIG